jgi:hypothetical protein
VPENVVSCFADPCLGKTAVCAAGTCALAASQPMPPPTPMCQKLTMGGATSCKDAGTWQKYASDDCAAHGLTLQIIAPGPDCGGGFTSSVDYVCCTP